MLCSLFSLEVLTIMRRHQNNCIWFVNLLEDFKRILEYHGENLRRACKLAMIYKWEFA